MSPQKLRVQRENQWFQRVESLQRNRKKRQHHRQFFVEGVWSIDQMMANDAWGVEALLYTPERPLSNWAEQVLRTSRARWHLELSDALMRKLSDKDDTSELLAITRMPSDTPSRIPMHQDALIVVTVRPASPGNLGTLIRSCDALGAHGLIVTGHAADLFDPRTIRAAAGSFFTLPSIRMVSFTDLSGWLEDVRQARPDLQIVGTSAHAETEVRSCVFTRPTVLLIGNESTGLSRRHRELCDQTAGIPMTGTTPSLNMACAATAVLYEVQRQRRVENADARPLDA